MRLRGKAIVFAWSAAWLCDCSAEPAAPAVPFKPVVVGSAAPAGSGSATAGTPVTVTVSGGASGRVGSAGVPAGAVGGVSTSSPSAQAGVVGIAAGGTGGRAAQGGSDAGGAAGTPADASQAGASAVGSAGGGATDSCTSLPAVTDYAQPGPFADAKMFAGVGPSNGYHLYRPDASLGKDGFKHPIATWGNGIATTPDQYQQTLTLIASHGFVIIACNDTQAERACLSAGLDWLVEQNTAQGELMGKLDIQREVAIGYSWGGGAAIDTSDRPNIKATVSLHGMPPRGSNAFEAMHSPLLLFTSTGDSFVTASGYVTPNYQKSTVQTFYATLDDGSAGHLYVVDTDAVSCAASAALGDCRGAQAERAPVIAWLRYWACADEAAKPFFFGDDCTLCKSPWTMPQRKMWP